MFETGSVKGSEFLRKLKRFADRQGLAFRWVPARGSGSHGTVYVGDKFTIVKDLKKEIGSGLFRSMCRDLNLNHRDI